MNGGLVLVFWKVPVDAIVAGVDFAADEPLPAGRVAGIERGVPILIPIQEIGVFLEALRKVVEAEPVINPRIGHVRLGDEFR